MVLGMLRSVAGWKADKYRFDVTVHNAYIVLPGTKALQVVWKRGNKHAQTKVRDPIKPGPRVPNRETPAKMLKSRGLPPAARPGCGGGRRDARAAACTRLVRTAREMSNNK